MKKRKPDKTRRRPSTRRAKKLPPAPELTEWQSRSLAAVGKSSLARDLVFGSGAALATVYLHHRFSEDLDFFLKQKPSDQELAAVARDIRKPGMDIARRAVGPTHSLVLSTGGEEFGKIDFALAPYPRIARPVTWHGFKVESLRDMTVNKVQAILTRFQPRDFVDLSFLLREGPERSLSELLERAREKFGIAADPMTLAERLVAVGEIQELPRMIRPVDLGELREFFWEDARRLVRAR